MLNVTVIGTGALQPLPGRALASAAITCMGRTLLLDCGEGTQAAAKAAGVSLMKTDVIALTHYHGDHILGLPGLLQSLTMAQRTDKLWIFGPEGLEEALLPIQMLTKWLSFPVEWRSLPQKEFSLGEVVPGWPGEAILCPFFTCHGTEPSQGYRFEHRRGGIFQPEKAIALNIPRTLWKVLQHGKAVERNGQMIQPERVLGEPRRGISIAYTGDTIAFDGMIGAVQNVDLLISEATYGDPAMESRVAERGHMSFCQAANLAKRANARELWLTHFSPMISDPEIYLQDAQAIFPNTLCGKDGMTRTFCFEERKSKA